jgi:hypothetical protein
VQQAAARVVQTAGDIGTAITVRFNIAVRRHVAAILIFLATKAMLSRLSSAACGHKVMHLMHLQQVLVLTQAHMVANGVVA